MTRVDQVGSVVVVTAICLLLSLLLRERAPSSWPRSALWLAPVALVGSFFAIAGGGSHYLLRFAGVDGVMVLATVVLSVAVAAGLRWRGCSWPMALWFAGCVLLVGVTTLPSQSGPPALRADAAESLRACVMDPERWLPPGVNRVARSQVSAEFVPNIALFMPIGLGLVLALAGRLERPLSSRLGRLLVVSVPLLVSMSIETYQALFTTRVCAPIDVMSNTAGGVLGGLLAAGLLRTLGRAAPTQGPSVLPRNGAQ
ncbi:MAG: VanZ family protein [Actinomycetota bacterium]|nr:VanZ family protein [Actinomycetota bacterium]